MYDSENINFKDGVTAIIGENGTGKSTIFEGIEYAFYGKVKRKGRFLGTKFTPDLNTALIQTGKKSAAVELNFTSPITKRNFTVVRKISESGSTAELSEGKKLIAKGISGVSNTIESLIGLNLDAFSAISYVRQGEIADLTSAPPSERESIVNSILNLEIYEDAAKKANEEKLEIEKKIKEIDAQASKVKEHQEQDKKKYKELQTEFEKVKPILEKRTDKEKKLKSEKKIDEKLKELNAEIEGTKKHIKSLEEKVEEKIERHKTQVELNKEKQKFQTPSFVIYGSIGTLILSAILFFVISVFALVILILGLGIIAYSYHKSKAQFKPDTKRTGLLKENLEKISKQEYKILEDEKKFLSKLEQQRNDLKGKISVEDIDTEVTSAEEKKEDSLSEAKDLQGSMKTLSKKLTEYDNDLKTLEKVKRANNKRLEDLGIVVSGILKAVPRWIRLRLTALVREETKNIFIKMFGGKYKDIQITNDYNVEVLSQYGKYFPVSMISGGEDTAANIALRIGISRALHKVYSEVRGSTGSPGLLIMDEPTTHLDRKRRELLIDIIKAVKDLPQVIISTNVEEVENAARNKIFLVKESPVAPTTIKMI